MLGVTAAVFIKDMCSLYFWIFSLSRKKVCVIWSFHLIKYISLLLFLNNKSKINLENILLAARDIRGWYKFAIPNGLGTLCSWTTQDKAHAGFLTCLLFHSVSIRFHLSLISIHNWPTSLGSLVLWSLRSYPLALACGRDVGMDFHLLLGSCFYPLS